MHSEASEFKGMFTFQLTISGTLSKALYRETGTSVSTNLLAEYLLSTLALLSRNSSDYLRGHLYNNRQMKKSQEKTRLANQLA
jgi:hypothetical protein